MLAKALDWFGFSRHGRSTAGHGHNHDHGGSHGHTHGVIDPTIATTSRGIWAIKWSFVILAITSLLQLAIVVASGSVALLADTIHNIGDAVTAIPLWIAFVLARRKPSKTFTYGLGRVEDLAGVAIVGIILFSALFAGYEAIDRLINPQPITLVGWVAAAGVIGFLGNEAVAVFRIRVGREINSAALIADGYHARTDGLTSLAVVAGAVGVWLGFPLADPIVGLLITVTIFGIVWQSSKAVFTRMLDGVDPTIVDEMRHAAEHVPGVTQVLEAKARWLGHRLHADVGVRVDAAMVVAEADRVAQDLKQQLFAHIPALGVAEVRVSSLGPIEERDPVVEGNGGAHHHAPDPFKVSCGLAEGPLATVDIKRSAGTEYLPLAPAADYDGIYESAVAPAVEGGARPASRSGGGSAA